MRFGMDGSRALKPHRPPAGQRQSKYEVFVRAYPPHAESLVASACQLHL
jgi:hypothetical protein